MSIISNVAPASFKIFLQYSIPLCLHVEDIMTLDDVLSHRPFSHSTRLRQLLSSGSSIPFFWPRSKYNISQFNTPSMSRKIKFCLIFSIFFQNRILHQYPFLEQGRNASTIQNMITVNLRVMQDCASVQSAPFHSAMPAQ